MREHGTFQKNTAQNDYTNLINLTPVKDKTGAFSPGSGQFLSQKLFMIINDQMFSRLIPRVLGPKIPITSITISILTTMNAITPCVPAY